MNKLEELANNQQIPIHLLEDGPVNRFAFTSLMNFEQCPQRVKLRYVDRLKGESSGAADRGSMIHDLAEKFTRGEINFPSQLKKMRSDMEWLKEQYAAGMVEVEEEWGIKKDWSPCSWRDKQLWGRIKLDAFIRTGDNTASVVDHKTGKKFGNEFKHNQQGQLYTIAAFERYPEIDIITSEFWYLDHGLKLEKTYTRAQANLFKPKWTERALRMTTAKQFPARPSKDNCRWCDYAKTEQCEWAYA